VSSSEDKLSMKIIKFKLPQDLIIIKYGIKIIIDEKELQDCIAKQT
jgi:hypothetical protein